MANLEKETTVAGQRQILAKIHKGLVAAQDIGDEKLKVVQVRRHFSTSACDAMALLSVPRRPYPT